MLVLIYFTIHHFINLSFIAKLIIHLQMEKLQSEFIRIQKIQQRLNQQLKERQERNLKDINRVLQTKKGFIERNKSIQNKSGSQIVTHPYNNANWMHLAHFVNNQQNGKQLREIQQRFKQRKKIRDDMQYRKKRYQQMQFEQEDQNKNKKKGQAGKGKKVIPWKLMRSMMQKDVSQNKRRVLKVRKNQEQNIKYYHQQSYKA